MVVVDSSALIPLARVGRLDLFTTTFDKIQTTEGVQNEVLTPGKQGTSVLASFLERIAVCETPPEAAQVASLAGVAETDAAVILLAVDRGDMLLANDTALIELAKTHEVACWWVTTLLLNCTHDGVLSPTEATDLLYDLVGEGMNLHPKVYTQVQRKIRELGD